MTLRLAALGPDHDLAAFRCGEARLDEWPHEHARAATGQGTRTYVLVNEPGGDVVSYFAITPYLLEREQAPRAIGRGAPARVPAILLAKLALDEGLQGQGLGAELLVHALTTITNAARTAGGRIIVVDALDGRAADFYRSHDFQALPTDPFRLVIKISSVARALGLTWP